MTSTACPPQLVPVVVVTTLVQALASMIVIMPATVAPELARAHGVDASLIGFQVSFAYIGAMATSVIGGTVVRRLGPLRCSQIALALAATGCALTAAPALSAVAAGAMFIGLGYGLTNPAAAQMLMKIATARNRNLVFSLKQTGVPLGGITAGLLAPGIALAFGWQAALLAGAGVTVLVLISLQFLRASWDVDRDPGVGFTVGQLRDMSLIWKQRDLRLISLASFTFAAMQMSLTTFCVAMLVGDLELTLVQAGVVLAALQVAGVSGRVSWGWVADRLGDGNKVLLIIAAITTLTALATVGMGPKTPDAAVYGILIVFGFTAVGWNGVFMAEVARLVPAQLIGSATGVALFVTFFGVVAGPSVFTALYGIIDTYTMTFGVFSAITILGFVLTWMARLRD